MKRIGFYILMVMVALLMAGCHDEPLVSNGPVSQGKPDDPIYFRMRSTWKSGRSPMTTRSLDKFYTNLPTSAAVAEKTLFPLRLYPQNLQAHFSDDTGVVGSDGKPETLFLGKTTDVSPSAARRYMARRTAKRKAFSPNDQIKGEDEYGVPYYTDSDGHTYYRDASGNGFYRSQTHNRVFYEYDTKGTETVDDDTPVYQGEKAPLAKTADGATVFVGQLLWTVVGTDESGSSVQKNNAGQNCYILSYQMLNPTDQLYDDNKREIDVRLHDSNYGVLALTLRDGSAPYKYMNINGQETDANGNVKEDNPITDPTNPDNPPTNPDNPPVVNPDNQHDHSNMIAIGYFDTQKKEPVYMCEIYMVKDKCYVRISQRAIFDENGREIKVTHEPMENMPNQPFKLTRGNQYRYVDFYGQGTEWQTNQISEPEPVRDDTGSEIGTLIPMEDSAPIFIPKNEDVVPAATTSVSSDDYNNPMYFNAEEGQLEYHDYPKYGKVGSGRDIAYVTEDKERPIFNTDLTSEGEVPKIDGYINPYHDMPYDPAGESINYNPTLWDDNRPIEQIPNEYPDENDYPEGYADFHEANGSEEVVYLRSEIEQMKEVSSRWPWTGDGAWDYESMPTFSTHDYMYDDVTDPADRIKGDHFVFNMKHANAILRIWFAVDRNYNKVRKIVLRDVKIAVKGSAPVAAFTNNTSYPVDRRYGFVVPVAAADGKFDNHEVYSVTFFKPEMRVKAEVDKDQAQELEPSPTGGETNIYRTTPLTFICEYDIYDNDLPYTRPYATEYDQDGKVVKQGMTYERKTALALDNHTHLVRRGVQVQKTFSLSDLDANSIEANITGGHYYDLYLTINPEYLYILSEHDNKHLRVE